MKTQTALVTGGGRGIGEAIVRRLSQDGIRVVAAARTRPELERVARETGCDFEVCDVTLGPEVDRLVRRIGRIDILVNNAGLAVGAPFAKTHPDLWRSTLDANLTSTYLLCRAAVPGMVDRNYGRIVNIASIAGKRSAPYLTAYCAAKHAVLGFSMSLAQELSGNNVLVNCVCPGYVDTKMTHQNIAKISKATGRKPEAILSRMLESFGQTRLLSPASVAEVAVVLTRPDCSHTGSSIDL